MTDKQRLLELLSDGKPHSHKECYRLGLMAHSRAADLRKDGHDVQVWREGNTYWYRLASPSESATCHNCGGTDYRHVTDDIFRCNACNAQLTHQEPEVSPEHPALGASAPFVPLPASGRGAAATRPEALFPDERHMYEREVA